MRKTLFITFCAVMLFYALPAYVYLDLLWFTQLEAGLRFGVLLLSSFGFAFTMVIASGLDL